MEIIAKNFLDAWKKSLKYILDNGIDFDDLDGRKCREIINLVVNVETIDDYEALIDSMQEFEWVYPAKEELAGIMMHKEESAAYKYTYGSRIFNYHKDMDQVNGFVIPLLKKDPSSRRAMISLYNPSTDSDVDSKNIPSLMYIAFKIKSGALNITSMIRSNDFFIGWPGNIYQIEQLHKYVAEKLGLKMGTFTTISSSAHIFHEHFEMIEKVIEK